jgi:hypothetical protein
MRKKQILGILLVLSFIMATFAATQATIVNRHNTGGTDPTLNDKIIVDSSLKRKTEAGLTLTDNQMSKIWPNLPSVDELLKMETVAIYDSADFGKEIDTSLIATDPNARLQKPVMRNYTDYMPQVKAVVPFIWLQIKDSTQWVNVPIDLLWSTNVTAIPTNRIAHSSVSDTSTPSSSEAKVMTLLDDNWALGIYTNPAQLYSGTILGAFSYGEFADCSLTEADEFIYSDILTVADSVNNMQIGMISESGMWPYVCMQHWNRSTGTLTRMAVYDIGTIAYDTLYSQFIRYNNLNSRWEFYWNQQDTEYYVTDGQSSILKGNQPSVCAESNSGTESHFTNCQFNIGGMYGTNYLAAIGFHFNGQWKPYASTDTVPTANAYHGNSRNNSVVFWVGEQGPMSWFGEQKKTGQTKEALTLGDDITVPGDGASIWT